MRPTVSLLCYPQFAHQGICGMGEHDGRPFIAMELLEGETLKHRIGGRPMDTAQVVEFGIQLADARRLGRRPDELR